MIYNIKDYGAVGDGRTLNTQVIQNTIDEWQKTVAVLYMFLTVCI